MKIKNKFFIAAVTVSLYLPAGNVFAVENIGLSGFFTVGATKGDSPTASQNGLMTNKAGFDQDTRVGIQISADVNPKINMTAQLIGKGRNSSSGRDNNFSAAFDWGYIDYQVNDKINVRAGKLKLPTYLISDYFEVGYAYPWIRPPQEVYYSNPISAITGIDLLFRTQVGEMDVLVQPYFGTSNGEQALIPQSVLDIPAYSTALGVAAGSVAYTNFTAENFAGINASIGNDVFSIRAGYLQTKVSAASFGVSDDQAIFASIGGTLDWNNIVVYSEYFEREIDDQANLAFPNQKGWYGTLGYRIGKFLPHITFASTEDNSNPVDPTGALGLCGGVPCGTPLDQESTILGLRYELGAGAALKVEAQRSEPKTGTRGLFLQNPAGGGDVTIFSLAVDVVF